MLLAVAAILLAACSSTKSVPDGDQLYIGLKDIDYQNHDKSDHFYTTQEEVEAALATAPNGAFFGSSYYRSLPYKLWIWNAFSDSKGAVGKWVSSTFGKSPVLMSWVNPELRASVAQQVLHNHGYLGGQVKYSVETQKNPKKAKIAYTVLLNTLSTIDTLEYANFPPRADSLIKASQKDALLHVGDPFDVSSLDAERTRISNLFRDNGYYYYQSAYSSYLADTLQTPGKVHLRLQLADNIPETARHKWYIGKIKVNFRKQFMEQLNDSFVHRSLTVCFNGKKPPVRPGVVLRHLKLRPRQMYSYSKYAESAENINNTGLYSSVQINFTPRDTTSVCDTLDMTLNCVFNKPYEFYVETNYSNKINGRTGPELVLGLKKLNAFRGGETVDLNLHGSYEWETGGKVNNSSGNFNSYEYGADLSVSFPRMLVPFLKRRRYAHTPSTTAKAYMNVLNRPNYFKMHTASGEWTYKWQNTEQTKHEYSPLILQYQYLNYTTQTFDSILNANPYLAATMRDMFIPKMKYTFTYSSPSTYRNPILWSLSVSEAGNILSLGYMAAGKKWGEENKTMFKNVFAQFVKVETDFSKTWAVGMKSQLVGHVNAGAIWAYGNTKSAPYSEQFYVGGANSIRAFAARSIGPGKYSVTDGGVSYLDQTGDLKFQANLEYRFNFFGSLYGAAFLDAGNVWSLRDDANRPGGKFKMKNVIEEMAVGTGVGLRYDLDFLILRLDWGVGIHVPYETGKSGYYNIPKFKDGQSIHLAVGYPF